MNWCQPAVGWKGSDRWLLAETLMALIASSSNRAKSLYPARAVLAIKRWLHPCGAQVRGRVPLGLSLD